MQWFGNKHDWLPLWYYMNCHKECFLVELTWQVCNRFCKNKVTICHNISQCSKTDKQFPNYCLHRNSKHHFPLFTLLSNLLFLCMLCWKCSTVKKKKCDRFIFHTYQKNVKTWHGKLNIWLQENSGFINSTKFTQKYWVLLLCFILIG